MIRLYISSLQSNMTNPQELKSNTPLEEEPSGLTGDPKSRNRGTTESRKMTPNPKTRNHGK